MELCRYTAKPLLKCHCKDGCKTNKIANNEWIQPKKNNYIMGCCDCGLKHEMDFRIIEGKIQFRAKRLS